METNNNLLDNQDTIINLINNIQTKLNNENNNTNNQNVEQTQEEKDESINENNSILNNNIDFSSILQNINFQDLLKSFQGNKTQDEENTFNIGDIDANTILRFQKILSSFNKNDPKKNLIKSLKPFLRKSRQDKIQEYLVMLSIVDAIGMFNNKGSD